MNASLLLLNDDAKKSKMTKNSSQEGSCLNAIESQEEMKIAGKYTAEKWLMQYKGDETCKIKNSQGVMHNIMRTWY